MRKFSVELEGISPYSQSRVLQSKKGQNEPDADFDQRVWREHIHADHKGLVFIPPMSVKKTLEEVAAYLSESVPGKRSAKYTKHFQAGILSVDPWYFTPSVQRDKVECETLFLNADGKRGGGRRVHRIYPMIPAGWKASGEIYVMDPIIQDEKLSEYLAYAGQFIGIGRFRPRVGGFYGRFKVASFKAA